MTALEQVKQRLLTLRPGESGIRVTSTELMEIGVPGVSVSDLKSRAEWLRKQLPFSCSLKGSATTGDWVFSRSSN
jgi:hypothetical protein